MAKLVLDDIVNLENYVSAAATINTNNAKVEAALEQTLSRNGTEPNEMNTDLDMNSHRVINLVKAVSDTEPVRLREFNSALGAVAEVADFDTRYLGAKTSPPSTDNEGNPLEVGTLYFQSIGPTVGMYVWDGDSWEITFASGLTAGLISYTPTAPRVATNVQSAIDEVYTLLSAPAVSAPRSVFDSRTQLATYTVDPSVNTVVVCGSAANGDGGLGFMARAGGASAYAGATTQDASGAYFVYLPGEKVNVRFFGAKGDGTTDDRTSIQNAINFAQSQSLPVHVPPGAYNLTTFFDGANYYCLKLNGLSTFIGTNLINTVFRVQDQFNPQNVFHVLPANPTCDGFRMSDFSITGGPVTPRRQGLHGIYIDTRTAGTGLAKPIFERLNIEQGYIDFITTLAPQAGKAIYHDNNQTNNPNGGMFGAIIRDCRNLGGAIRLVNTGDQNQIYNVILSGENNSATGYHCIGLHATLCTSDGGAGFITFRDSTVVCKGGMWQIDQAVNFICDGVYGECFGADVGIPYTRPDLTTGYALAVVDTGGSTIGQGQISNCRFSPQGGVSTLITANLYIGNASNITVDEGNRFMAATGTNYAIELSTQSFDCIIKNVRNSSFGGSGFRVLDRGARNQFNDYTGVTLLNSFTATGSGYNPPYVYRDDQNMIRLSGMLNHSGATSGLQIYTLPAGWRPSTNRRIAISGNASGTAVAGAVDILTSGAVTYIGPNATQISLDGVAFLKDDPLM